MARIDVWTPHLKKLVAAFSLWPSFQRWRKEERHRHKDEADTTKAASGPKTAAAKTVGSTEIETPAVLSRLTLPRSATAAMMASPSTAYRIPETVREREIEEHETPPREEGCLIGEHDALLSHRNRSFSTISWVTCVSPKRGIRLRLPSVPNRGETSCARSQHVSLPAQHSRVGLSAGSRPQAQYQPVVSRSHHFVLASPIW